MPLGPDLLPHFEDLDPAELKAKRAKVRSMRHDPQGPAVLAGSVVVFHTLTHSPVQGQKASEKPRNVKPRCCCWDGCPFHRALQ